MQVVWGLGMGLVKGRGQGTECEHEVLALGLDAPRLTADSLYEPTLQAPGNVASFDGILLAIVDRMPSKQARTRCAKERQGLLTDIVGGEYFPEACGL